MQKFETEIGGRSLSIEVGRIAKQADGACWVRYGDTISMVAVCASDKPDHGRGFFPLSVDYREKTYAAGKIPGGFFKREGRPSEKEILSARIIDRPLRPLFPNGYANEVMVNVTTISSDQENDADVLGLIGAAVTLAISSIPFHEILGAVRVGRLDGQLVINPTFAQLEESDLNLFISGTKDHIMMVEGGCLEISEDDLVAALAFGHEELRKICALVKEVKDAVGKAKKDVTMPDIPDGLGAKVSELAKDQIIKANDLKEKSEHSDVIKNISNETQEQLKEEFPDCGLFIRQFLEEIESDDLRKRVLSTNVRIDGRGPKDVRNISSEVGVLPRVHGSSIFTRGQTQALVVTTLGTKVDEQRIDALEGESKKSYMLHYNFPSYSVGEVRPNRGPGRREIGHGALAERALAPVLPSNKDFPYTIRVVSDILESNGSSSMATVCGGCLSMMDAGVPIKSPVAGIAMGLIMAEDKHLILTDILGSEDHFGDMDFKVTGTKEGITAFQLDIKIGGLTLDIMRAALEDAKEARFFILDKMLETMSEPRKDLSAYAPRIISIQIKQERIGEIIGPGGKNIRKIIEISGAKVDIEDDGTVQIASVDGESGQKAKEMIEAMLEEPELDKVYNGTVKRIADFGAFVEIIPNTDGLLHVSEIDYKRVEKVEDVMKVGDQFDVKVIGLEDGKIRLSKRALMEKPEGWVDRPPRKPSPRGNSSSSRPRGRSSNSRGGSGGGRDRR